MKVAILVPVATLLSIFDACASYAWIGYRQPSSDSFRQVGSTPNCMSLGVQNLRDAQMQEAIVNAAAEVCNVFASPEFADSVKARSWLASCDADNGVEDTVSGEVLYASIGGKLPNYSVHPHNPWNAIAQSHRHHDSRAHQNRVAVRPDQIRKWYSEEQETRGELVNTIAHETMHIISFDYADDGHGGANCPEEQLVSYGIGNLTERLWSRAGSTSN